jgi:hypothetical protein
MKNTQKGFAPIILIIIAVVAIGGGVYYVTTKNQSSEKNNSALNSDVQNNDIATSTNVSVLPPKNEGAKTEVKSILGRTDEGNDGLVLLEPNNYESIVMESQPNYTIEWLANDEAVEFYLETYNYTNKTYTEVGKLVQSGSLVNKYAFSWIGEINKRGEYPKSGRYYIKMVGVDSGKYDRSDTDVYLFPSGVAEIIMTLNDQVTSLSKPLMIKSSGQEIEVTWASEQTRDCELLYISNKKEVTEKIASKGNRKVFVDFRNFELMEPINIRCKVGGTQSYVTAFGSISSKWENGEYITLTKQGGKTESYIHGGESSKIPDFVIKDNVGVNKIFTTGLSFTNDPFKYIEKINLYIDGKLVKTVSNTEPALFISFELFDNNRSCAIPISNGSILSFEFIARQNISQEAGKTFGVRLGNVQGCLNNGMTFTAQPILPLHTYTVQ